MLGQHPILTGRFGEYLFRRWIAPASVGDPVVTLVMISPVCFSDTLGSSPAATNGTDHPVADNPEKLHDAELVRRFNAGDEGAFAEIVTRYHRKAFTIAYGLLRNHADAEEIAQDTFVRAYRGLVSFRGESSLAAWLHRIAFNLSCNRYGYFLRRHRNKTRSFDCTLNDDSTTTFADVVPSDIPDPAREIAKREFLAHVAACLKKLSAPQREILSLRALADQSYDEIAATLGLNPGTVKSRIARARDNLLTLLAAPYPGVEPGSAPASRWFEPNRPAGHLVRAGR